MIKKIFISSFIINSLLIAGKLSGFLREILVAKIYGVSINADIVVILLTFPDLIIAILVGGAISSALIPVFSQNKEHAKKYAVQTSLVLGGIFLILALFLGLNASEILKLFSPTMSTSDAEAYSSLFFIVIISIPISVVTGIYTAYLQSMSKYFYSGLNTVVFNGVIIFSLIVIYLFKVSSLYFLCGFILLASLIRFSIQFYYAKVDFRRNSFYPWLIDKKLVFRYIQAMGAGCVLVLYPIVVRTFVSSNGDGYLAMFNYSMRLVELPQMLSITFVITLLLPKLSSSFNNNKKYHGELIISGFHLALGLSVVLSVLLYYSSEQVVSIIFSSLNVNDSYVVSKMISYGALTIPFHALNTYMSTICFSQGNAKRPMVINIIGITFLFVMLSSFSGNISPYEAITCLLVSYCLCLCIHLMMFNSSSINSTDFFKDGFFILSLFSGGCLANYIFNDSSAFNSFIFFSGIIAFGVFWMCIISIAHGKIRQLIMRKYFV
ncbi:peptidoglycan biosynthesis protein MviN/MurJ (putative lipid II flippase) [Vibrio sp. ES.051]|uniref:murein biosynthesis integral membrane protein MurJ n=1 Tax=Vibrio sp. ES.051 TaxID=1761909 RepID=UPI000BF942F5|nr:lipid II flippase MurJ [Vibrio sp. ES.051]PFG45474.1 peptidoglycan biosynthesis protein MviN/MurJ (putative lipid II flippase) [Vibrio sp. ES.051]